MLDELLQEVLNARSPAKNLKYALLGLGFSVLASPVAFFAMDSFVPGARGGREWVFIVLYFLCIIFSGVYALLACRNSIKSLKTNKDIKNYIALIIGGLLLLGICRMILGRL